MKNARFIFSVVACMVATTLLHAQLPEAYQQNAKAAMEQYDQKNWKECASLFEAAFATLDGKAVSNDRYNAACCFALGGNTEKAFYHLFYLAEKAEYSNLSHVSQDADLNTLHDDERWEKMLALVAANKEKAEANLNKPLAYMLDSVLEEDQKYRRQINEIAEKSGWDSPEMKELWGIIREVDSINLIKVTGVLDEYGWLGSDVIGGSGNQALFLVIQHSELEVQEKYLPMMRDAVEKGNAQGSSLALLEDRVALRQGKRQIYGSQVGRDQETNEHYVLPLEDSLHVDERRAAVGLGPLADYVSNWNIEWDPEKYLEMLPEIEAKQKK